MRRIAAPWLLAALLSASPSPGAAGRSVQSGLKPVIRQVDHILIESGDPGYLFSFFSDTLQLPVAWPLAEHTGFTSGGVSVGNVNLEVLQFADRKRPEAAPRSRARFIGLALEPFGLGDCLAGLKARGIAFDPPTPYVSKLPDGSEGTLWTNVVLPEFSRPGLSVFLCEYNSAFLHAEIRRNQLGGQLALRKGGPLGIRSVKEIILGSTEPARGGAGWRNLLAPSARPAILSWQAGNGPAIRLAADSADRIQRITLKVDSLAQAKAFLAEKRWLGAASAGGIAIEPLRIQGLMITLEER